MDSGKKVIKPSLHTNRRSMVKLLGSLFLKTQRRQRPESVIPTSRVITPSPNSRRISAMMHSHLKDNSNGQRKASPVNRTGGKRRRLRRCR